MTRHIGRGFGTGTHARARRGAHGGVTPSKTPHPLWQHKRDYPYVKLKSDELYPRRGHVPSLWGRDVLR